MGSFTDHRDGRTYRTVQMPDGRIWMAENLDYDTKTTGSKSLYNNPANRLKYGMLYDWETAKNVAPPGWCLPTQDEWEILANAVGYSSIVGTKLKSKSGWNRNGNGTDDFGFSALPGGLCNSAGDFRNDGSNGNWWSSSDNKTVTGSAHFCYMNTTNNIYFQSGEKIRFYSVRYVQKLENE